MITEKTVLFIDELQLECLAFHSSKILETSTNRYLCYVQIPKMIRGHVRYKPGDRLTL